MCVCSFFTGVYGCCKDSCGEQGLELEFGALAEFYTARLSFDDDSITRVWGV